MPPLVTRPGAWLPELVHLTPGCFKDLLMEIGEPAANHSLPPSVRVALHRLRHVRRVGAGCPGPGSHGLSTDLRIERVRAIETTPGWMQAIAENQPITHMVDAVRALTQGPAAKAVLGHQASYYVTRSLLWTAAIVAVFAPQGIRRKHRRARSGSVQRSRFARPGRCYLGAYVWTTVPELNAVVPRSVRWVTSIPSKRR